MVSVSPNNYFCERNKLDPAGNVSSCLAETRICYLNQGLPCAKKSNGNIVS